jgi:hypothetical protein
MICVTFQSRSLSKVVIKKASGTFLIESLSHFRKYIMESRYESRMMEWNQE